ncbi:putative membrane protein [Shouchella lonarensis]|uniref:Putative membrane protein n=2 Tax=Shouchella lonarensis TaxID=1464122 RepID=A0A1G6N2A2_9BACI|nr:putative membrane protein [Shouchella lonarensis]
MIRFFHDPTADMTYTASIEQTANVLANLSFSSYLFLFVAGWLASTALVLPGVSGALIMLVLGVYNTATTALKHVHIPVIVTIGLGVCAGVLTTSRVCRFFFNTYTQATYAVMIGLVAGSVVVIFPVGVPHSLLYGIICVLSLFVGFMTAITFGKAERT